MSRSVPIGRRSALLAAIAGVALPLAGCSERGAQVVDKLDNAADADGIRRSANGTITEWAKAARPRAAAFQGPTETGTTFSSASLLGKVSVVNFWYAGCPPCRVEAPDLQALWKEFRDRDVQFLGVNIYDSRGTATAFSKTFGITYPSILDRDAGGATLAFASVVSIKAAPNTLVLDRQGRVAARILGKIPSRGTLRELIKDVQQEPTR